MNVTTDIIIFYKEKNLILLGKRRNDPFKGCLALPGGFLEKDEDLISCAKRELEEETGIVVQDLKQLYTVGNPDRDPRGYTVTVVYYKIIDNLIETKAFSDLKDLEWVDIYNMPNLSFDHKEIIEYFKTKKS